MADCGVRWRLGEVPVYVAPKNSTLDHHVLKMKDATDAMFAFGQRHDVQYLFQSPAEALVQDGDGRIVGVVVREGYGEEVHPRRARRRHPHGGRVLQQQGALAALHPHSGHGLRLELPHGGRDRRVLPAWAWA
ncbi:MAG: hypothetical protein ACLVKI_03655 [Gordonibacter urolithinfaciens]